MEFIGTSIIVASQYKVYFSISLHANRAPPPAYTDLRMILGVFIFRLRLRMITRDVRRFRIHSS